MLGSLAIERLRAGERNWNDLELEGADQLVLKEGRKLKQGEKEATVHQSTMSEEGLGHHGTPVPGSGRFSLETDQVCLVKLEGGEKASSPFHFCWDLRTEPRRVISKLLNGINFLLCVILNFQTRETGGGQRTI